MASFFGGSAYAMANQICEGYASLNIVAVKRFNDAELNSLRFELDKLIKSLRGEVIPEGELDRVKERNRKVSRINQALLVIQGHLQKKRR